MVLTLFIVYDRFSFTLNKFTKCTSSQILYLSQNLKTLSSYVIFQKTLFKAKREHVNMVNIVLITYHSYRIIGPSMGLFSSSWFSIWFISFIVIPYFSQSISSFSISVPGITKPSLLFSVLILSFYGKAPRRFQSRCWCIRFMGCDARNDEG